MNPGLKSETWATHSGLIGSAYWGRGASHYLDEVVEAKMAGEGFLDLIGGEFVVLLRRHDRLVQGQANDRPAQQTLGNSLFARFAQAESDRSSRALAWCRSLSEHILGAHLLQVAATSARAFDTFCGSQP